jgi:hypothetical protein
MAIEFPDDPTAGQLIEQAGITYRWNGISWDAVPDPMDYKDIVGSQINLDSGAEIIDHNESGLIIKGDPSVTISGALKVDGVDIFDSINDPKFYHDSGLFPDDIGTLSEAVEYSFTTNHLTEDILNFFGEGISGSAQSNKFQLTVTARRGGSAAVTNEQGIYIHESGSDVEIKAIPMNGYEFDHWSGSHVEDIAETGNATTLVTIDKHQYVTAYFKKV